MTVQPSLERMLPPARCGVLQKGICIHSSSCCAQLGNGLVDNQPCYLYCLCSEPVNY